jgi:two-component sensor histidine kinase
MQTVAALLRLQGRRLAPGDETARAALTEAERRVGSIALVHETLSRTLDEQVDFDEVADRIGALIEVDAVRVVRDGTFGRLIPEVATPLALVLVELLQNAAEHGLGDRGGRVRVAVRREGALPDETLLVTVTDDGPGAPEFDLAADNGGLGLQIVRTLVESELAGELSLLPGDGAGAQIRVRLPLPPPPESPDVVRS